MRTLIFGMNVSLDGYIAAPGDDINWSEPVEEVFLFWCDRMREVSTSLYGRKLYQTMYPYWQTADQEPGASEAEIDFARSWQSTPKVVFSSTLDEVGENARLVTSDPVVEIRRLKEEDGGPMEIGGATLASAAMRAGLIDEYLIVTYPVLVGGGTPFFTALVEWVNLDLVETRQFPGSVLLTRYAVRRP
jgi:dihydrofolate reductase